MSMFDSSQSNRARISDLIRKKSVLAAFLIALLFFVPAAWARIITDITSVPVADQEKYYKALVDLVERNRGWKTQEYKIIFHALDKANKKAAFTIIHVDRLRERKQNPGAVLAASPLEFSALIHTEELTAWEEAPHIPSPWNQTP